MFPLEVDLRFPPSISLCTNKGRSQNFTVEFRNRPQLLISHPLLLLPSLSFSHHPLLLFQTLFSFLPSLLSVSLSFSLPLSFIQFHFELCTCRQAERVGSMVTWHRAISLHCQLILACRHVRCTPQHRCTPDCLQQRRFQNTQDGDKQLRFIKSSPRACTTAYKTTNTEE